MCNLLQWKLFSSKLVFAPLFAHTVGRSSPRLNRVALTFDGGPDPEVRPTRRCFARESRVSHPRPTQRTPALLELLAAHNIKASFFVEGRAAHDHADLVREIKAQGHEVGCLGRTGPAWTSDVIADITKARAMIEVCPTPPPRPTAVHTRSHQKLTGDGAVWYRPADGSRDVRVIRSANRVGLRVALWSVCAWDWTTADIKATCVQWPAGCWSCA